jgi:hypothetical protein
MRTALADDNQQQPDRRPLPHRSNPAPSLVDNPSLFPVAGHADRTVVSPRVSAHAVPAAHPVDSTPHAPSYERSADEVLALLLGTAPHAVFETPVPDPEPAASDRTPLWLALTKAEQLDSTESASFTSLPPRSSLHRQHRSDPETAGLAEFVHDEPLPDQSRSPLHKADRKLPLAASAHSRAGRLRGVSRKSILDDDGDFGEIPRDTVSASIEKPSESAKPSSASQSNRPPPARPLSSARQLRFPSREQCDGVGRTTVRQVAIPASFTNLLGYRSALVQALCEYINLVLAETAQRYHSALVTVDTSAVGGAPVTSSRRLHATDASASPPSPAAPACKHGPAKFMVVRKEGPNKGRAFYACSARDAAQRCDFFQWIEQPHGGAAAGIVPSAPGRAVHVRSSSEMETIVKARAGLALYVNCSLSRHRLPFFMQASAARRRRTDDGEEYAPASSSASATTYDIGLSHREHSTAYGLDDIWILSTALDFSADGTALARSVFFGPNADNALELAPLTGGAGLWRQLVESRQPVHAIHLGDTAMMLACLDTLEYELTPALPLLPVLLRGDSAPALSATSTISVNKDPMEPSVLRFRGTLAQREEIVQQYVTEYRLNEDQAIALRRCGDVFTTEDAHAVGSKKPAPAVLLVHGVFGAGKSFLLAVMIKCLVELASFRCEDEPGTFKILLSSLTNVAVDRVLQCLVEVGCESFVRVGSVRKIAKSILPFSVHAANKTQELKELRSMLANPELDAQERVHVRKAVERMQRDDRETLLRNAPVVGLTIAAAHFPCMRGMHFPIVVLDECSQLTEPMALQAVARFGSAYMVLVGDPLQLPPTLSVEAAPGVVGLEQTLFSRLQRAGAGPVMLRTQYRMHPQLSALPNALFYGGRLKNGVSEAERAPLAARMPTLCFVHVTSGQEQRAGDGSFSNSGEVAVIWTLLEWLDRSGVEGQQVGVVCLYKAQADAVRSALQEHAAQRLRHLSASSILVSTVDAFQGGERDVVLVSTVRTHAVGFIDSAERTNVALSRARRHLFVLGNASILRRNALWGRVVDMCAQSGTAGAMTSEELAVLAGAADCETTGSRDEPEVSEQLDHDTWQSDGHEGSGDETTLAAPNDQQDDWDGPHVEQAEFSLGLGSLLDDDEDEDIVGR